MKGLSGRHDGFLEGQSFENRSACETVHMALPENLLEIFRAGDGAANNHEAGTLPGAFHRGNHFLQSSDRTLQLVAMFADILKRTK